MARRGENIRQRKDGRWEGRYIKSRTPDWRAQYGSVYADGYLAVKAKLAAVKCAGEQKKPNTAERDMTLREALALFLDHHKQKLRRQTYDMAGHIPSNPCENLVIPKKQRYEYQFYNDDQLESLFEAIRNDPIYPMVRVTAVYGLRRSELLGLQWDSVDFNANTLTIKHTVVKVLTTVQKDTTKTTASYRAFPLLPDIRQLLLQLKAKEKENRRLMGREYQDSPYIFKWTSGKPYSPDYLSHRFLDLLRQNGLPHIRFHDLRHSCASLLIAQGFGLKDVQEWLGHADITLTANTYAHLDMKRKQTIAQSLAGALSGKC